MKRLLGLGLVSAVLVIVSGTPAMADMYDYSEGGMDGSDWQLQKHDMGWIDVVYSIVVNPDNVFVNHKFGEPTAYHSRAANVWTAPAGEYITQLQFNWNHSTDPWGMSAVVFILGEGETLNGATTMAWTSSGYGWQEGSQTLTFTEEQQITKIGLGFAVHDSSWPDWQICIMNPVITTTAVPEPATLSLLAVGGLGVLLRRKK